MDFQFEKITEEEFEKRKNAGEFGEVSTVIQDLESEDMMSDGAGQSKSDSKDYVRQTFLLGPDLKRAIKRKAANEDRGINEMVREILCRCIEKKYFEKY